MADPLQTRPSPCYVPNLVVLCQTVPVHVEIRQKKMDPVHPTFEGHSRQLEPKTDRSATYDFLLVIYSSGAQTRAHRPNPAHDESPSGPQSPTGKFKLHKNMAAFIQKQHSQSVDWRSSRSSFVSFSNKPQAGHFYAGRRHATSSVTLTNSM